MSRTAGKLKEHEYLFVPDVRALRAKIRRATGTAAYLWRNIQALPYADDNGRYYPAFLYLVTGREAHARAALQELKKAMEFYRAGERSLDVHFHTWCNSAPLARLAVMFDWIADSKAVSRADYAAIKEALLDYTLKHPYNIAKSRTLTFDNQISAMSFCCALVGYLFGVKRGRDPRAQRLMEAGVMRFPDIFALSPPGGYSFEGSTYFCQIVAPVVSWYVALMEQISGEEYFTRRFAPSNVSAEDILRTYHRLVGPSGLMPPWDHYGWMRCASTMGLAYLARKTGDPAPLAVVEKLGLGAEPGYIAWGSDDKLWTLIWWPDERRAADGGEVFRSWAVPNIGGALVDEAKAWRLFQAWDRCAPSVYCGRAQVNPNMISMDLWGSVVITDGTPGPDGCPLFDYPIETFRDMLKEGELESIASYYRTFVPNWDSKSWVKGFAYGLIGGSNSIVINGEGHYAPQESKEGRLVSFAALPNLKLVSGEAVEYYRPRYPVTSMLRTSMLVRDDYFLVRDSLRTDGTPLRFDWQVFARGEVGAREGGGVRIATPEGVELDVVPLRGGLAAELTAAPGFPKGIENSSTRIRYRADGTAVDLAFLLVPHRTIRVVEDLGKDWCVLSVDEATGAARRLERGLTTPRRVAAAECGLASADGRDGWVWAAREFIAAAALRGRRSFLHFASRVFDLRVWINGAPAAIAGQPAKAELPGGWYVPATVEITDLLRKGRNTVVIAGPTCQGRLVNGTVELMVEAARPVLPSAREVAPGQFEIRGEFGCDRLLLPQGGDVLEAEGLSARAHAVLWRNDDDFAALQATRLSCGAVQFWSERPIDVAVAGGRVTLGDISGPDVVELLHPRFHLRLQSRGALDIDLCGTHRPRIETTVAHDKPVLLNGVLLAARRNPHDGALVIPPSVLEPAAIDAALPAYVGRLEELMRAATREGQGAMRRLLKGLGDRDWKIRLVAAELLGRRGDRAAIAPLLESLARETPETIYRDELLWWRDAVTQLAADAAPWASGAGSSPDWVKRHRLKAVIIEALGRLRATEAVAALAAIVDDQREFYPVHSLACEALGRIGDAAALPALNRAADYAEVNTKFRARDAISRITTGRPASPDYPGRSEG